MYLFEAMAELPWLPRLAIRLVVAAALAGLVGLEREHRGRSAGFRTQMLVGLGSALAMIVGLHFARLYGQGQDGTLLRIDPTRVAYGVMTGIGFLGAGTIIAQGASIRGLTTAASLWCTAAVGLAAGLGLYELAVVATAMVLLILYVLTRIDAHISAQWDKKLTLTAAADADLSLSGLTEALAKLNIRVRDWGIRRDRETGRQTLTVVVSSSKADPEALLKRLAELEGIQSMSIE
jgi:putative Mg2+ transporter-C (MgtC) family protein